MESTLTVELKDIVFLTQGKLKIEKNLIFEPKVQSDKKVDTLDPVNLWGRSQSGFRFQQGSSRCFRKTKK